MSERRSKIRLLGLAALSMQDKLGADDFEMIRDAHDLAVYNSPGFDVLDTLLTPEISTYEELIIYFAEKCGLTDSINEMLYNSKEL